MASGRDISFSHASKDQHLQKEPLGSTPPDRQTPLLPSTTERPGGPGGSEDPDQLLQRLIHFKRQFETGQKVKAYAKSKPSRQRYSQLRSRIEQSFRQFDYEPERERLIVRMPSAVHDIFYTSLENEVTDQLRSADKRDPSTTHFLSQIVSGASSEIDLDGSNPEGPGPQLSRQPDQQFQHKKAVFPGVVLEISYAQDGKQLGKPLNRLPRQKRSGSSHPAPPGTTFILLLRRHGHGGKGLGTRGRNLTKSGQPTLY